MAAPEVFAVAGFDVPADHVAVTLAFEVNNPGEALYQSGGFSVGLASSDPCEGFAYVSDDVTGVPEVVDAGNKADFKYGYICKGDTGDKLTLKVGLDPNSAITRITTTIP